MSPEAKTKAEANVEQAVPFFRVSSMETSLRYDVDGLGFQRALKWVYDGNPRLVLAPARRRRAYAAGVPDARSQLLWIPESKVGVGVSICFQCKDALALHGEFPSHGIQADEPFVGNRMWVVTLSDPDGYRIEFESPTEVAEDTKLSEGKG